MFCPVLSAPAIVPVWCAVCGLIKKFSPTDINSYFLPYRYNAYGASPNYGFGQG